MNNLEASKQADSNTVLRVLQVELEQATNCPVPSHIFEEWFLTAVVTNASRGIASNHQETMVISRMSALRSAALTTKRIASPRSRDQFDSRNSRKDATPSSKYHRLADNAIDFRCRHCSTVCERNVCYYACCCLLYCLLS